MKDNNNRGIGELPDPQKAKEFFVREGKDWALVQQASANGDKFAVKTIRIFRLIESAIDKLWEKHQAIESVQDEATKQLREKECLVLTEMIGELIKMRVEILYVDFKIQDKRDHIMNETRRRTLSTPAGFAFSAN